MKKLLAIAAILALSATMAFAQEPELGTGADGGTGQAHRNTGCGLGTMLFGSAADESIGMQVLQATTNGSFGAQTFGITFGTSECERPTKYVANDRLNEFVRANLDELARDIAAGRGETLGTLAELLSVPAAETPAFARTLKSRFAEIFPGPSVEYAQVVDALLSAASRG